MGPTGVGVPATPYVTGPPGVPGVVAVRGRRRHTRCRAPRPEAPVRAAAVPARFRGHRTGRPAAGAVGGVVNGRQAAACGGRGGL